MEKFSTLTEQDVKRITNLVKEQVDVSEYDDSDFIEVFVKYFRPWIKKFHGDEVSEYPMSHLVKKYTADFIKDYGIEIRDRYYSNDLKKLVDIGKSLVVKGTHNLPSLKKEGRFLEKYDKGLKALIEYLDLPKFMKIKFREDKPYNVGVWIEANFDEMLKYDGEVKDNSKYMDELKNYISSFLGVEYGSPAHGNLHLVIHCIFQIWHVVLLQNHLFVSFGLGLMQLECLSFYNYSQVQPVGNTKDHQEHVISLGCLTMP